MQAWLARIEALDGFVPFQKTAAGLRLPNPAPSHGPDNLREGRSTGLPLPHTLRGSSNVSAIAYSISKRGKRRTLAPGRVTLQKSVGVDARMADVGRRIIRDHMPDQHRDFFAAIPFIIAGAVDVSGDPWVTLLSANPVS